MKGTLEILCLRALAFWSRSSRSRLPSPFHSNFCCLLLPGSHNLGFSFRSHKYPRLRGWAETPMYHLLWTIVDMACLDGNANAIDACSRRASTKLLILHYPPTAVADRLRRCSSPE
jgi:hypothetical protein